MIQPTDGTASPTEEQIAAGAVRHVHVVPNEEREHIQALDCWCEPGHDLKLRQDGTAWLWVKHNHSSRKHDWDATGGA